MPDSTYDPSISDYAGLATQSAIRSQIQGTPLKNDSVLYLANSSPSMRFLEFGLYPLSPVKGSYNYMTGTYEIRSKGGYSKQAPKGIIGVAAMKWPELVADAQAKYAGPAS
jgi:hypothetical protein